MGGGGWVVRSKQNNLTPQPRFPINWRITAEQGNCVQIGPDSVWTDFASLVG